LTSNQKEWRKHIDPYEADVSAGGRTGEVGDLTIQETCELNGKRDLSLKKAWVQNAVLSWWWALMHCL
jgi:hypothetical protein